MYILRIIAVLFISIYILSACSSEKVVVEEIRKLQDGESLSFKLDKGKI